METNFLQQLISTTIYLVPLLTLVWKGARLASKIDQIEATMKEKISKFCNDHKEMQSRIETEREETDRDISAIMKTLNEIQQSIVRIETKLEIKK